MSKETDAKYLQDLDDALTHKSTDAAIAAVKRVNNQRMITSVREMAASLSIDASLPPDVQAVLAALVVAIDDAREHPESYQVIAPLLLGRAAQAMLSKG